MGDSVLCPALPEKYLASAVRVLLELFHQDMPCLRNHRTSSKLDTWRRTNFHHHYYYGLAIL